ncbi:gpi c transferase [Phialemonium atrogriseum]|uniref:Gpi c transferase n=1 Tax=Phialemonium atrogriseum TaxID=1093897 RepID=A0AAJ0CBW5_9PEZI|nr:gpi c transferase [Phialemonium atrogriseum]KAK1772384.1 gpi c transferase [Phialemonium atrogriseum]
MLTTAPHLHIRRPSPTTAEFIVTTCPPMTLALRLLLLAVFLGRLLLATSVLLLLHSKWELSPFASTASSTTTAPPPTSSSSPLDLLSASTLHHLLHLAHASAAGRPLARLAAATPAWALGPACLAALYASVVRAHATESLLVLRGLGVQTASTGATYLGGGAGSARFIPTEKIRDVLINEAFRGFEVRYYLVVVVEGEEDVVVVFPGLLPGRRIVETVWRGVRGCLYESDGGVRRLDEKG